jgi:hypothetical protein
VALSEITMLLAFELAKPFHLPNERLVLFDRFQFDKLLVENRLFFILNSSAFDIYLYAHDK